jgi:hypothetical protein
VNWHDRSLDPRLDGTVLPSATTLRRVIFRSSKAARIDAK